MTDLASFAGRFHPLLVHFPIALLLLAAVLRAIEGRLSWFDSWNESSYRWSRLVLALGALSAVASASTGWLLGAGGGYDGDSFLWHQRLGIGVAVVAVLALTVGSLPGRRWRRAEAVLMTAAAVLLLPAGHLGASLTHGEGYFTEHAPAFVKRLLGNASGVADGRLLGRPLERVVVYTDLVAPVLTANCVPCHGPAKAQGGLRLDTADGLVKGGDDGRVVTAGRASASELVRRIYLPTTHEDAMPPKGHRALSPADAGLIRWWVESGARFDLTLEEAEIAPDVLATIEAQVGPLQRGGPTIPAIAVDEPGPEVLAAVRAEGFSIVRIADGRPFLHVHSTNAASRITDTSLKALAGVASQILWLDLGATRVSDGGLIEVARLPNLTRLHLQHTAVGDGGLAHLVGLQRLEYLNLYGTVVTDEGLMALSSLKRLRSLYVWETRVTPAGISRVRAALPRVTVESGAEAAPQRGSAQ